MGYRESMPAPALAGRVAAYWALDGATHAPRRVLPDGCADLICDFSAGKLCAFWVGTMTRPLVVVADGPQDLFGIRFAPGGLFPWLGVPLRELTDRRVELPALLPRHWRPPLQALADERDFDARCQRVESSLLAAWPDWYGMDIAAALGTFAAAEAGWDVRTLSRRSGLGVRTLERRCLESLGVSPRQHLRFLRFERARTLLESGTLRAADIALACGYSDQAHFVREFARFTGVTPGRWRG